MLLNMIEPARPIHPAFHQRTNPRGGALYDMKDCFPFVRTFDNAGPVEDAGVTRLSAPGGIKSSAVKSDGSPATHAFGNINDARIKFDEMRISVVESFGSWHFQLINNPRGKRAQARVAHHISAAVTPRRVRLRKSNEERAIAFLNSACAQRSWDAFATGFQGMITSIVWVAISKVIGSFPINSPSTCTAVLPLALARVARRKRVPRLFAGIPPRIACDSN